MTAYRCAFCNAMATHREGSPVFYTCARHASERAERLSNPKLGI